MGLKKEKKSVSERLDNLLIQILESLEQYVSKKEEYIKCVRDGLFDLTVHGLNRNSNTVDRYDLEDDFTPLYKVSETENGFVIRKCSSTENEDQKLQKEHAEEELRKRKGELPNPSSEWIEENDSAEQIFEEKVLEMKKDPLYLLNPVPTMNQRKAQKTLQNSFVLLSDVCSMKRTIDKLIEEYEALLKLE